MQFYSKFAYMLPKKFESSLTTPSCTNTKAFSTITFNDIIADTDFFALLRFPLHVDLSFSVLCFVPVCALKRCVVNGEDVFENYCLLYWGEFNLRLD